MYTQIALEIKIINTPRVIILSILTAFEAAGANHEGAKTAINWRAAESVTLFKAHDFLAKARVSGGAEGRAGACVPFSCNPAITCRA